jgi:menaquinone-dependent protoporphyrinogen oxidase
MPRALIVHASRHGATAGIAERIGEILQVTGVQTVVAKAADMPDPAWFDACVIGAGVYMGSWVKDGTEYLEHFAPSLAARPVWLFSSGPLKGSTKNAKDGAPVDPVENALGPATGPGSGGRRKVEELAARIKPRDHRVFYGAYDPTASPANMSERFVRMMPGSQGILPPGDFRDWPEIEAWALEIAAALAESVPVG